MPRCLGEFKDYRPLVDRVCRDCNNKLGLLDEQLCRSAREAFFRRYLGIQSRERHEKVNPFYRGSAGGKRIECEAVSSEHGVPPIALELTDGTLRERRQITIIDGDGRPYQIPVQDGMTPALFRKQFDSLGIKSRQQAQFYCDGNEVEWIRSLLSTLGSDVTFQRDEPQPSLAEYNSMQMTFEVTSRYIRAIAKIAFHCFLGFVPRFRGDEDCFREIRKFIQTEGGPDNWNQFVSLEKVIYGGSRPVHWGHLVTAEIDYLRLTSRIQLFQGPEFNPPLFTVNLGRNPSRIDSSLKEIRYFEYFPQAERRGEFMGTLKQGLSLRRRVSGSEI
jgi:hypothetical protein